MVYDKLYLVTSTGIDKMYNRTVNEQRLGWVSEPEGRGTASLLLSCLFTVFICTWTALHMNVPDKNTSELRWFFNKVGWVITGVIAPEVVSMGAFYELYTSRDITKDLNSFPMQVLFPRLVS